VGLVVGETTMTTARGTQFKLLKPLLHAVHMSTMTTDLTPVEEPLDGLLTEMTQVDTSAAFVAPNRSDSWGRQCGGGASGVKVDLFAALSTRGADDDALLGELSDVFIGGSHDDGVGDLVEPEAEEELQVRHIAFTDPHFSDGLLESFPQTFPRMF
jgi:hypothetical protein